MTPSQQQAIDAIRERLATMPAGDYTKRYNHDDWGLVRRPGDSMPFANVSMEIDYDGFPRGICPPFVEAKRKFVSHAQSDIAFLLSRIDELTAERDEANERRAETVAMCEQLTDALAAERADVVRWLRKVSDNNASCYKATVGSQATEFRIRSMAFLAAADAIESGQHKGEAVSDKPTITSLVPYFGSNRMLAEHVGEALGPCEWVGIPFFGSGPELLHIKARTIVANDLHHHVINLARVIQHPHHRPELVARLQRELFHETSLGTAQAWCREHPVVIGPDVEAAANYFISQWMGRSGKAGTDAEFSGGLPIRWNASGGDSAVRYRSAVRSIMAWGKVLQRVNFVVSDGIEFLGKCKDEEGHGIYCDPPFPDAGAKYKHQVDQHELAERLTAFTNAKVVCRFYDHPLVRALYPEGRWHWIRLKGRKSSNAEAPEVLICN